MEKKLGAACRAAVLGAEAFLDHREQRAQAHRLAADRAPRSRLEVPRHHVEMRPGGGLGDEVFKEQRRRDGAAEGPVRDVFYSTV